MNPDDAYWDDLGVAWRAVDPDLERMSPLLQARLRRQSFLITTALTLGLPLCGAGIALGLVTIERGWTTATWNFVTRGVAITVISGLLFRAIAFFLPLRDHTNIQSLQEMLDIAKARIRRTQLLLRVAMLACAIAAVFGIAGTVVRTRAGSPPHLSPIIDLIIIVLIALCLWLYARTLPPETRKLDSLRRTLGANK